MKTAEQIIEKVRNGGFDTDWAGFGLSDLVQSLSFENAKEFLNEESINAYSAKNDWQSVDTDEKVLQQIAEYVNFAQGKIDDERGLSADRSCQHFIAWFWLIDEQFSNELIDTYNYDYVPYGQPVLDKVKKYLTDKKIQY